MKSLNRSLNTVIECRARMRQADSESQMLESVCQALVDLGGYGMAWVGYAQENKEKLVTPVAFAGNNDGYLEQIRVSWADDQWGNGPIGTSIRTGLPSVGGHIEHDPQMAPWREQALRRNFRSCIALPLRQNGHAFGALILYSPEVDVIDGEEVHLLTSVADDLAYSIEAQRSEAKRRRAEELFATAFLCSPASMMLCDLDDNGRVFEVNESFEHSTGFTRERIVGKNAQDLDLWVEKADFEQIAQALRSGRQLRAHEFRYRTRNGELNNGLLSGDVIYLDGRRCAITASINITERKRAEEAARERDEKFRALFHHRVTGIAITSPNGRWLEVNDQWCRMVGYSQDELQHLDWTAITHPDDLAAELVQLERLLAGEIEQYSLGKRLIRKDGSILEVEVSRDCVRAPDGSPRYIVAVVQDISAHKKAEAALVKSEAETRLLLQNIHVGVLVHDADTAIQLANPHACHLLGLTHDQLMGKTAIDPAWRFLREDGTPMPVNEFPVNRVIDTGKPNLMVVGVQRSDRSDPAWLLVSAFPEPDLQQGRPRVVVTFTDVTERREMEESLRENEERFRSLYENATIGLYRTTPDGQILLANPTLIKMLGFSSFDALQERNLRQDGYQPGYDRADFERRMEAEKEIRGLESSWTRADGTSVLVRESARAVLGPDGEVRCYEGTVEDITERKKTEDALTRSERQFRTLIEDAPVAIGMQREGLILWVNQVFLTTFGYQDAEEVVGQPIRERWAPEDREWVEDSSRKRLAGEVVPTTTCEATALRKDGTKFGVRLDSSVVRLPDGPAVLFFLADINERKASEEALLRLRRAVDTSGEVVFMTDRNGLITFVNPEFTSLYGYSQEEVVGKTTPRILKGGELTHEQYADFWRRILSKEHVRDEIVNRTKDGNRITLASSTNAIVNNNGEITGFMSIQKDITQQKRLEEQFLQAQKMEAVGRLAGGVAHDFNNLLGVICGYTELLLEEPNIGERTKQRLNEVRKASERAVGVTRQLLAFSHKQVLQAKALHLNDVIRDMSKMLCRLLGEDINLVNRLAPNLALIEADPTGIDQILMNLAVNARDAMPQGGNLTVETAMVFAGHLDPSLGDIELREDHVMLTVADSGCGMDEETQKRAFEPFFTTKDKGRGTGLGLSTVYGIVQQSKGKLSLTSKVGIGTTFRILFPAVASTELVEKGVKSGTRSQHSGTILLVEDDPELCRLNCEILKELGYEVFPALNALEAIQTFDRNNGAFHLLLTDVVMPGMNGRELAQALLEKTPELKILFVSGYSDNILCDLAEEGTLFLEKPFGRAQLSQKLAEIFGP